MFSAAALGTPVPLPGGDLTAHVDLAGLVSFKQVVADARGSFLSAFPLPNDPSIVGAVAFFQALGAAPGGCGQTFVTTNGLALTVQP